jgi:hypothetical protein
MRKIVVVVVLAMAALIGTLAAPKAEAQVSVSGLRPFSPEANYMSLAGYLRWVTLRDTGRWISREEAEQRVRAGG